ncbi:MAG: hypothetical protein ABR508_01040 [Candidatus Baltobacteraceae bacterium]
MKRHWIPPLALLFAQLAHGFSWGLVFAAAWTGNFTNPLFAFAWIHTVALAWITTAALAILLHALPNFIDTPWRGQSFARWCITFFAAGVAGLIAAFLWNPALLGAAASIILIALLGYLTGAFATIGGALRGEPVQRAVARAFGGTFAFLFAAALAGFGLAWMLAGARVPVWVGGLARAHAHLGTIGWLTLLIFGVSMRTFKPMSGSSGTRFRWVHIIAGVCGLLGALLLAAGVSWAGGALFAAAALVYAFDTFDILRRAANPHRPPQAFIAASVLWLLLALGLGCGVLAGEPWQRAYVFVLLMGWAGQMVNAHVYHIGIRLLATVYRGAQDETPPGALLETRLSWYSWAAFQMAVAIVAAALVQGNPSVAARGAVFGAVAWIAMAANIAIARMRAATASRA